MTRSFVAAIRKSSARATAAAGTPNVFHSDAGASCQQSASATTTPSAQAGGRQYGEMSMPTNPGRGSQLAERVRPAVGSACQSIDRGASGADWADGSAARSRLRKPRRHRNGIITRCVIVAMRGRRIRSGGSVMDARRSR